MNMKITAVLVSSKSGSKNGLSTFSAIIARDKDMAKNLLVAVKKFFQE